MGDDPGSPFLQLPATAWRASSDLAFAILDRFPVGEGHTLLFPKRSVASGWDATEAEQHALLSLAEQVKQLLADRFAPDGWNLGVNIGRAEGHRAGLVVMVTGLGKTWLAAFDTLDAAHTLFIAHREEILQQSLEVFRQVQPDRRLGLATGAGADLLALTGDNLVVDVKLVEGIERGQLVPFHYLGIRDDTGDYAALPWRTGPSPGVAGCGPRHPSTSSPRRCVTRCWPTPGCCATSRRSPPPTRPTPHPRCGGRICARTRSRPGPVRCVPIRAPHRSRSWTRC
jgi:hypothetical protein